jgi:hypothetical protein
MVPLVVSGGSASVVTIMLSPNPVKSVGGYRMMESKSSTFWKKAPGPALLQPNVHGFGGILRMFSEPFPKPAGKLKTL